MNEIRETVVLPPVSEMVERVARAICIGRNTKPDQIYPERDNRFGDGGITPNRVVHTPAHPMWWFYVGDAKAAIAAMREPTEKMVEIAELLDDPGSSLFGDPSHAYPHDDAWRVMVDEALR